jgi:predicted membrane channel-forming protein YqfA (hemolysin III family)
MSTIVDISYTLIVSACSLVVGLALNEAVKSTIEHAIPEEKYKSFRTWAKWGYVLIVFLIFATILTIANIIKRRASKSSS